MNEELPIQPGHLFVLSLPGLQARPALIQQDHLSSTHQHTASLPFESIRLPAFPAPITVARSKDQRLTSTTWKLPGARRFASRHVPLHREARQVSGTPGNKGNANGPSRKLDRCVASYGERYRSFVCVEHSDARAARVCRRVGVMSPVRWEVCEVPAV